MLFPVLNFKAKSSWKGEIWCWACGSQFLNVWMNWIIYLQRISELFKWRWLYLITLHAMRWDAALDSFSLSVWLNTLELFVTLAFRIETLTFLFKVSMEFMVLFHVVTWLSKINVKCQSQQWSVSLYQINHHYVRKMEQRLSVISWTSKLWVIASKMLGNNASWQLVTPWLRIR